jgi:hypothetical protein
MSPRSGAELRAPTPTPTPTPTQTQTSQPSQPRPTSLPELGVPAEVLVVSLPARGEPSALLDEWLQLDPTLGPHRAELERVVTATSGEPQPGEVAAFLAFTDVGGRLVGGSALLTLELIEPLDAPVSQRADRLVTDLRAAADRLGHGGGLAEVGPRRTTSGVSAVRLRFLAVLTARPDADSAPMVEACRWLYPLPERADLAWSLVFQTTDLADADRLVAEFDDLAASLAWSTPT